MSRVNPVLKPQPSPTPIPMLIKLSVLGGALTLLALIAFWTIDITTVRGNEIGVKETWGDGVVTESFAPKTYFLFPGWSQDIYRYSISPNIYVMGDIGNRQHEKGRASDAYVVKSADNQSMTMELAMQWRFDPAKIVQIHKQYRSHINADGENIIEERLLRPCVMKATNTESTSLKAIDAYSGEGFVKLQRAIEAQLTDPNGELRQQGIIVENFVIQKITLADDYIGEISKRQVAQQRELRAKQEEQAALAEAQRAKAEAQADYEKQVVEAKRKKEQVVLESEGAAAQQVNAAKAEAQKVVLAANAEKEAGLARASAILAIGTAEAEATKLKLAAYSVPGSDNFVKVEVSKQMAEAFKGIQGYLPEHMNVTLLSDSFLKAVEGLMGRRANP